ncbi:MAG: UDP-3-O-[3-hydroxymyristoyl] N-acetylglucosamine deacetylase, partial [Mesorhizobium sp.]
MGIVLHDHQTTVKTRASLTGTGVHSGKEVSISFLPADADTGIVFQLLNGDGQGREFRALFSEIGATDLCTMLGDPSGEHIATVEHIMAALFGLGIDNVIIEIDGHEVPILDGSAMAFVEAIDQAGIEVLAVKRRYIRVVKPVRIENGASWAEFRPYDGTRFEVEIDFESPAIGRQLFASDINADIFRRDIARARTFGFMKDVERLWAAGYAL